jgi:glycyl-tRNA synthetase beta chain
MRPTDSPTTETLLVELLTEELPPKALRKLADAFAAEIVQGLEGDSFLETGSKTIVFATPRRIAVQITNVRAASLAKEVRTKLMPVSVGLDGAGKPTAALKKKLQSLGYHADVDFDAVVLERISREQEGRNEVFMHTELATGSALSTRLQVAIEQAIAKLPIPKVMSYQLADGQTTVQFVRPVHRLLALHGSNIVAVNVLGLAASNVTAGHRFQGEKAITLGAANEYEARLESIGNVIPSFGKRRAEIDRQLRSQASTQNAMLETGDAYDALLDEVTALVEYPTIYVGEFEPVFLEVPQECLILTMRANQKYFPLLDSAGKLTNKFLIVSNMRLDDATNIISGNERVIRPRLSDARFFFDQDRKQTLESRLPRLASVVYHNKLGSLLDRVKRIEDIAGYIATEVGADSVAAMRAARLCKADLVCDMVGEFPELQGIMGGYYARHDKESESVAKAIACQYALVSTESPWADVETAVVLFASEKTESLVGIFGIGLSPTGDKDPFALRRAGLGLISAFEIFANVQCPLQLSLRNLLARAVTAFGGVQLESNVIDEIVTFVYERYRNRLQSEFDKNLIDAVMAIQPELDEVRVRILAVQEFRKLAEAASLAAANKRIGNILKKTNGLDSSPRGGLGPWLESLLVDPAEKKLASALAGIKPVAEKAFAARQYEKALSMLAGLKAPVDEFFNDVMVMADDEQLRRNRLLLLQDLHSLMNKVADISKLTN